MKNQVKRNAPDKSSDVGPGLLPDVPLHQPPWRVRHHDRRVFGPHPLGRDPAEIAELRRVDVAVQGGVEGQEPPALREPEGEVGAFLGQGPASEPAPAEHEGVIRLEAVDPVWSFFLIFFLKSEAKREFFWTFFRCSSSLASLSLSLLSRTNSTGED